MHSQPIEQKKSRSRKDEQQKCTHILQNKRNQGQERMTSRNALTTYRTKEIKAKKGSPAKCTHNLQNKRNQGQETSRNALTSYRTKEIKAKKGCPAKCTHFLQNKINQGQERMPSKMHPLSIEKNKSRPRKDDKQNEHTSYRTKEIKAKKGSPAEMLTSYRTK